MQDRKESMKKTNTTRHHKNRIKTHATDCVQKQIIKFRMLLRHSGRPYHYLRPLRFRNTKILLKVDYLLISPLRASLDQIIIRAHVVILIRISYQRIRIIHMKEMINFIEAISRRMQKSLARGPLTL